MTEETSWSVCLCLRFQSDSLVFCLFRSHSLHVCSLIYQRLNSALSFQNNLDTLLNLIEISFLCFSVTVCLSPFLSLCLFHTFTAAHFLSDFSEKLCKIQLFIVSLGVFVCSAVRICPFLARFIN